MESTFANRVLEFRKSKSLSQPAFAKRCDLTQGNISQMELGTEPKRDNVAKILTGFPDLNPDWLLTGNGSMLRDGRSLAPIEAPARQTPQTRDTPVAGSDKYMQVVEDTEKEKWWKEQLRQRDEHIKFLTDLLRAGGDASKLGGVSFLEDNDEAAKKRARMRIAA